MNLNEPKDEEYVDEEAYFERLHHFLPAHRKELPNKIVNVRKLTSGRSRQEFERRKIA